VVVHPARTLLPGRRFGQRGEQGVRTAQPSGRQINPRLIVELETTQRAERRVSQRITEAEQRRLERHTHHFIEPR